MDFKIEFSIGDKAHFISEMKPRKGEVASFTIVHDGKDTNMMYTVKDEAGVFQSSDKLYKTKKEAEEVIKKVKYHEEQIKNILN